MEEFSKADKGKITNLKPSELKDHFSKIGQDTDDNFDSEFVNQKLLELKKLEKENSSNEILNEDIKIDEVHKSISKAKSGKSEGIDGITNDIIKALKIPLLPIIHKMFNYCLKTGSFPERWVDGLVVPLPKIKNPSSADDFRGLTITSAVGKLFISIITTRITKYLDSVSIPSPYQSGFRKKYKTTDNIIILKTIINKCFKKKKYLYACFIDLNKAFDRVWREGLYVKLLNLGISGNIYKTIKSMFDNSKSQVKVNNNLSNSFRNEIGLMQGNNLSPLLFNVFIDDLVSYIEGKDIPNVGNYPVPCLMYADDMVILSETKEGLQNSLDCVDKFCHQWRLKINSTKTKILVFNKSGRKVYTKFYINNCELENVCHYNYLGVSLQASGSFSKGIDSSTDKALTAYFKIVKALTNIDNRSIDVQFKLFDSLVKPIILYACDSWGDTVISNKKNIVKIEKLQLNLCKHILKLHSKSTNSVVLAELGRFPLFLDIKYRLVKTWLEARVLKDNPLLTLAINEMNFPENNWLCNVQNTLDEAGMGYIFTADLNDSFNINSFLSKFKTRLHDNYIQSWKQHDFKSKTLQNLNFNMSSNTKHDFYYQIKTNYCKEPYLDMLNGKSKQQLTNLRLCNHDLLVQTGRYERPPIPHDQRICTKCNLKEEENETRIFCYIVLITNL
ncbi:hypothetical protein SNE40_018186 [Patella caerulea]|uniref:Reverse transcriptase domain-containing protein n=1 Tax=Patella caerulea TaxID=87958 RepID=A0AAN8JBC2_PATCE